MNDRESVFYMLRLSFNYIKFNKECKLNSVLMDGALS
jgi:hypothetical protein